MNCLMGFGENLFEEFLFHERVTEEAVMTDARISEGGLSTTVNANFVE